MDVVAQHEISEISSCTTNEDQQAKIIMVKQLLKNVEAIIEKGDECDIRYDNANKDST